MLSIVPKNNHMRPSICWLQLKDFSLGRANTGDLHPLGKTCIEAMHFVD